jgi:hypothetical protein
MEIEVGGAGNGSPAKSKSKAADRACPELVEGSVRSGLLRGFGPFLLAAMNQSLAVSR